MNTSLKNCASDLRCSKNVPGIQLGSEIKGILTACFEPLLLLKCVIATSEVVLNQSYEYDSRHILC